MPIDKKGTASSVAVPFFADQAGRVIAASFDQKA